MPLFHFHLVTDDDREHIGSMDLPSRGEALPSGLKLTTQLLAGAGRGKAGGQSWTVQATDDAGALVYNFEVSRRCKDDGEPSGYVH